MNDGILRTWSKYQSTIALSSAEAEYVALCDAMRELMSIRQVIEEMKLGQIQLPIVIHEDNQAVIKMATSPWTTSRSRHIDIRLHFVRDQIQSGDYSIIFTPTDEQIADCLTKACTKQGQSKLIDRYFDS